MKKTIILALACFLAALTAEAQQYDVLDQVRSDPRKSWGMEGPHRFDGIPSLTKAPKGYKPFYLSHYGRHGSRYCWSAKTYTRIHDVLSKAQERGVLTAQGQAFAKEYESFYMEPWINAGDLVPLGFEQHERIGRFVYDQFTPVFKGDRRVEALASTAQRCILSMSAFVQGLTARNGALQVHQASNHMGMCVIAPPSAPEQLVRKFKGEPVPAGLESVQEFARKKLAFDRILGRLFTDTAFLDDVKGGDSFLDELWQFVTNYHNYESRPLFDNLFTDDERVAAWETDNYFSFYTDLTMRYQVIPLLEDILEKADAAQADPSLAANLRFGHDYIVESFATLLNLNHCGTIPTSSDEAKYWFQSYNVPMAATLLFVLYKNRQGDVLFKVLWNEAEAVLPQLEPVQGPYYRWSDFVAWAQETLEAHPEIQS